MKTYYSVTTTVYDNGRVAAAVTGSVEAGSRPVNHCTEKRDRDIYCDWFDTIEEAQALVKQAKEV